MILRLQESKCSMRCSKFRISTERLPLHPMNRHEFMNLCQVILHDSTALSGVLILCSCPFSPRYSDKALCIKEEARKLLQQKLFGRPDPPFWPQTIFGHKRSSSCAQYCPCAGQWSLCFWSTEQERTILSSEWCCPCPPRDAENPRNFK